MLVFSILLLMMVGAVFVYSPAVILNGMGGSKTLWIVVIFVYYIIATMLPIDKIIGKVYPLFAFSLLFMAAALLVCLLIKMPALPEIWDGLHNRGIEVAPETFTDPLFPCLFITIACGAISGFHATQSPLMARCIKHEKMGRPIFYGAMITEGIVALIWATVAMYFFYGEPAPGYTLIAGGDKAGFLTAAPAVVNMVCNDWLGLLGATLALLGVVAAPITSGDTALRSARLIIADFLHLEQRSIKRRLYICIPLFALTMAILLWQVENPDGFNIIWKYFGWSNQTLSVFTLWTITVYLVQQKKPFVISLIPALFMTTISCTFLLISKETLNMGATISYTIGGITLLAATILFFRWYRKNS